MDTPAALIPGDPHQAAEVVAAAGTVGVIMTAGQAAVLIVEVGEINLGHGILSFRSRRSISSIANSSWPVTTPS